MKLVFFATVYEFGGVSGVIKNIADNLDREKAEIALVVESLAPGHYRLRDDIKIINIGIRPAKTVARKLTNMFRHIGRIRAAVLNEKPDAVLSFGFPANCLLSLAFLLPAKNTPKIVLSEHTEQLFIRQKGLSIRQIVLETLYRIVIFLFYRRADAVVCVSDNLARHIGRLSLMDAKRVKVIHNSVNIDNIKALSQEEIRGCEKNNNLPWVGTVSRLSFEKGLTYLIEAFFDLIKKQDARLIIVGDGPQRPKLEKMARDLNMEDKIIFAGWSTNPYSYLKKMDVFVLPSLCEGFPTAVLEAMVCGVPVVATRSAGGIEEIIEDGRTGLLIPPMDKKALSGSIYNLLSDKDLRVKIAKEAYKKVQRFDSRKIVREYESLLLNA